MASNVKGTGFTNIQRMISASDPSRLGTSLANNIKGTATNLKTGVKKAGEDFKSGLATQQQSLQTQKDAATGAVMAAPEALDDTGINAFQNYMGSTVNAVPLNVANTNALRGKAQQQTNLATNPYGQAELLRGVVSNPKYDTRKQQLDSMILQRDKNSQNLIKGAKRDALSAIGDSNRLEKDANITQQNAQTALRNDQKDLRGNVDQQVADLRARGGTAWADEKQKYADQFAADPNAIAGLFDEQDKKDLWGNNSSVDLSKGLIEKQPAGPSQSYLTDADFIKRQALARLTGALPEELINANKFNGAQDFYDFDAQKAKKASFGSGGSINWQRPAYFTPGDYEYFKKNKV